MPINTVNTGAAIAAYRQRMNLSQQELASLMNVTHQAVSKWEKGLALPDTETLLALAKLFGTSMENLLMGKLPVEPESKKVEKAEELADMLEEDESDLPPEDADHLNFSAVMNMLPFVSTKVADRLFRTYAEGSSPDVNKLTALAPFVSTRALNEYLLAHPLADCSPEMLCGLAPFLPTTTVDHLILELDKPLPPHMIHALMPFASPKVADQMVLGKLGIPWEEDETEPEDGFSSQQLQNRIRQKLHRKFDKLELKADSKRASAPHANRESPRMRLIRKAMESGHYDLIENCFDELDSQAHRQLLNDCKETGDAKLLQLLCENAGELDAHMQLDLVQLLIDGKMYGELAEVIEELDEDMQHALLDRAFEQNDPELIHLLSEHL